MTRIVWSYDRLTAEEQTAFVRLAVFPGGWTLDAAEAVLARDTETRWRLVSRLVAQSMVRSSATEDSPRFTMLETVRAFGMERLAAGGELETVRRWHADYFLNFAEVVANSMVDLLDLETAPACLVLEQDNLREALAWAYECGDVTRLLRFAVALRVFWFLRGRLGEGRAWIDRARLAANRGDVLLALKAAAFLAAGWYARRQGDNARAEELGQQRLALFQEVGDAVNTAETLELLGRTSEDRGDFRLAQARHQEELDFLSSQDKSLRLAMALRNLGWTTYLAGDTADGERGLEEALAACRQFSYDHGAAAVMSDLGALSK